jgi:hypothetical protein
MDAYRCCLAVDAVSWAIDSSAGRRRMRWAKPRQYSASGTSAAAASATAPASSRVLAAVAMSNQASHSSSTAPAVSRSGSSGESRRAASAADANTAARVTSKPTHASRQWTATWCMGRLTVRYTTQGSRAAATAASSVHGRNSAALPSARRATSSTRGRGLAGSARRAPGRLEGATDLSSFIALG